MSWLDLGLIFPVDEIAPWAVSHAYVPTALDLADRIRVYCAFLDAEGRGRLGFVDVDRDAPTRILGHSREPILADSQPGGFDCDGVTPLAVAAHGGEIRLYYAGWQRLSGQRARYRLLTGLALSGDGDGFRRYRDEPLLAPDRPDKLVLTAGTVVFDGTQWRCWYADDVGIIDVKGKAVPSYQLCTMQSADGLHWPSQGSLVFATDGDNVFGYGRSAIWRTAEGWHGLFSVRRRDGGYRAVEHLVSPDGFAWSPPTGADLTFAATATVDRQQEVCFPSVIPRGRGLIMFYNGDQFGRAGLRAATWSNSY